MRSWTASRNGSTSCAPRRRPIRTGRPTGWARWCPPATTPGSIVGSTARWSTLGKLSYAAAVFQEAMHFKPLHYVLGIDHGVRRDVEALLVAVGNCGYFGGGINVCPAADPTDGELDVTIVHPVGVGTLMREFPNLYNGTFVRLEQVETLRCTSIHVDGDGLFALADGEEIGDVPIDLDVVPASLDVFVNRPLPHMTTPE
ncbi:hypothetical protein [Propionibacterium freudenreichii]|uniref:hypothetical protein n=1 Tax=Propionibacterium freudenreichii TaxID=1744 RepID=UPI0021A620AD|nr:hypothetical protein [Propionibacterium freudenreichii]